MGEISGPPITNYPLPVDIKFNEDIPLPYGRAVHTHWISKLGKLTGSELDRGADRGAAAVRQLWICVAQLLACVAELQKLKLRAWLIAVEYVLSDGLLQKNMFKI